MKGLDIYNARSYYLSCRVLLSITQGLIIYHAGLIVYLVSCKVLSSITQGLIVYHARLIRLPNTHTIQIT